MAANLLRRDRKTTWVGLLVGTVLVILVGELFLLPPGDSLARTSYDAGFPLISRQVPDDLVMVYLDARIKANLGQSAAEPLDRHFYTLLLDRLTADGAKLVMFDIIFDFPHTNASVDAQFAEAIRRQGKVVLVGYTVRQLQGNVMSSAVPPIPLLTDAAAGWGLAEVTPDPADKCVRILSAGDRDIPSVDWVAASILNAPTTKPSESRLQNRWMNYYCEPTLLQSQNLDQVLETNFLPSGYFHDKIVIVGARPLTGGIAGAEREEFSSPYSRFGGPTISGPSLHALSTLNLLHGDWMTRLSFKQESVLVLLWGIIISAGLLQLRPGLSILVAAGAFCVFAVVAVWMQGRFHVWFSWLDLAAVQTSVAMIWSVGFQYTIATRRQRKLRRAFASYLSPYMADRIANSDFDLSLGGSEVDATVMFTDLEGFTNMTESLPPKEVSQLLISYFQETSRAILEQDGTIIKYIGDAVMAVWGAPLADPQPNQRAVLAALGIRKAGQYEFAGRRLRTRCGINSGLVLAGNLGSDYRFDYTLIGETTNLASRLEGLNKYLGTDIIISESVRRGLDGTIRVRNLGRFILSGTTRPVEVYEVLGLAIEFQPPPAWLDLFAQALVQFTNRQFDEAETLLKKILGQRDGKDGPANFYLKQIARARTNNDAAVPWDGIVRLDSK